MTGSEKMPRPSTAEVVSSWFVFCFAALCLLGLVVAAMQRGKFVEIFEDFDSELPLVTIAVLSVPTWLVLATTFLLLVLILVVQLCMRRKIIPLLIHGMVMMIAMLLAVAYVIALFLPLLRLM